MRTLKAAVWRVIRTTERPQMLAAMACLAALGISENTAAAPVHTGSLEVMVCLYDPHLVPAMTLAGARATAARIYQMNGIRMNWSCGKAAIGLQFDASAPTRFDSGVLAYAMPYSTSGTLIYVLVSRVLKSGFTPRLNGILLGYVMAHEVAHVLQGISRHSETGVLKARWSNADCAEMEIRPFAFAAFPAGDAELIRAGMARREALGSLPEVTQAK